LHFDSLETLK